ncbi:MAG: hypothetical protein ACM34I_09225 [bacterium]
MKRHALVQAVDEGKLPRTPFGDLDKLLMQKHGQKVRVICALTMSMYAS